MPAPTIIPVSQDYLVSRLSSHVDIANSHLLEIGCGSGRLAEVIAPRIRLYTGIDISVKAIREAENLYGLHPNVYFRYGNAESLDTGEVRFDVVLYGLSLHMIRDKDKTLHEAARVLKDGGLVAVLQRTEDSFLKGVEENKEAISTLIEATIASFRESASYIGRQTIFDVVEHDAVDDQELWLMKKA